METSTREMPNTIPHFEQIMDALKVESGSLDFDTGRLLWSQLAAGFNATPAAGDLGRATCAEEALVWRILSLRMLRELGAQPIFQARTKGAATGGAFAHPALEAIAKTYERLRRTMDELTPKPQTNDADSATGLPMRMLKMLEESEGALEQVLGVEPGEASPFTPRLVKRENRSVDDGA